jgi:hypothetical protein
MITLFAFARRTLGLLLVAAVCCAGTAQAFTLNLDAGSQTSNSIGTVDGDTYTVTLHTMEQLTPGFTAAELALINNEFDGIAADGSADATVDWTFQNGVAMAGSVYADQYDAALINNGAVDNSLGGAILDLHFDLEDEAPTDLRWIQIVTTNVPLTAGLNPTVDPPNQVTNSGDDNLPFYFTEYETANGFNWNSNPNQSPGFETEATPRGIQNPSMTADLVFLDFSKRLLSSVAPGTPVTWNANLYLVSWDGTVGGTVTIHDGVSWGFDIAVVPLPATVWLLLSGLASLGAFGVRKRRCQG